MVRLPRRYWQLRSSRTIGPTVDDWAEEVRAKLVEAVRAHLIADVPVGAFLSGGLDSGIVVGLASGEARGAIQTFSIGFREQAFSELPDARRVADMYGTRHVEEVVTADAASLVDELTQYYDEPFADARPSRLTWCRSWRPGTSRWSSPGTEATRLRWIRPVCP